MMPKKTKKTRKSLKYIMESSKENQRLESQSKMAAYDFRKELEGLKVPFWGRVLDAGCGAGNITLYLSFLFRKALIEGWDVSPSRIASLQKKFRDRPGLRFEVRDLLSPGRQINKPSFDLIIGRYLLQHFSKSNASKVVENLVDFLKPGGTLRIIDIEGLFSDIYPSSPFLRDCLKKIQTSRDLDLEVGRKIPSLFLEAGLEKVNLKVTSFHFREPELSQEYENIKRRINNAWSFLCKILGNEKSVRQFQKEYLKAIRSPGSVLLYEKFEVTGQKRKANK